MLWLFFRRQEMMHVICVHIKHAEFLGICPHTSFTNVLLKQYETRNFKVTSRWHLTNKEIANSYSCSVGNGFRDRFLQRCMTRFFYRGRETQELFCPIVCASKLGFYNLSLRVVNFYVSFEYYYLLPHPSLAFRAHPSKVILRLKPFVLLKKDAWYTCPWTDCMYKIIFNVGISCFLTRFTKVVTAISLQCRCWF